MIFQPEAAFVTAEDDGHAVMQRRHRFIGGGGENGAGGAGERVVVKNAGEDERFVVAVADPDFLFAAD